MSVAFHPNTTTTTTTDTNRIQLQHRMWITSLPDTTRFTGGYPWSSTLPAVKEEDDTTSSSIGNNSDAFSTDSVDIDVEVQSKDNNALLTGLTDLEQVLPIKRGISTFYAGKSKSYGSLNEAVSIPSIQDIVKPEDAYSRKRKNMIAHHAFMGSENGLSKRLARNNQTAGRSLPPLPRNTRNAHANEPSDSSPGLYVSSRSFSLSDLQQAWGFNGVINNGSKAFNG